MNNIPTLQKVKSPCGRLTYLTTSDIHLGHPRTPTSHIASSLVNTILTEENQDIDILFINGDLYDRLLTLKSVCAQQAIQFFHRLLDYCYTYQIKLRVLEGTPDHDWYQSTVLVKLNDMRQHKVDLVYHRVLDIEYFPEYDRHVLYIPDVWCKSQEDLERQVNEKLSQHGIAQVDIAMLHGQFSYQVAHMQTKAFTYDEAYMLRLVKGFIHIGHFHTHTSFDRIIANGSLERLAHNEEEPKGYVKVIGDRWTFHINTQAWIYKTVKITPKFTLQKLDKLMLTFPEGSYVRLLVEETHELALVFKELQIRYQHINLTKKTPKGASEDLAGTYIPDANDLTKAAQMFTETSIYDMLVNSVQQKHQLTPTEHQKFMKFASVFKADFSTETMKD